MSRWSGSTRARSWKTPEVAIVILSGHQLPQREDMPLKATFVAKPFSTSVLLQQVAEALVEV